MFEFLESFFDGFLSFSRKFLKFSRVSCGVFKIFYGSGVCLFFLMEFFVEIWYLWLFFMVFIGGFL